MKKILIMLLSLMLVFSLVGCGGNDEKVEINGVSVMHGEIQDLKEVDNGVVVKAKIEANLTNDMTIQQNFYNIEDLVLNQGFDKYDMIDYWAVADMSDGSEDKVIAFTIDKDTIKGIKEGNIVGNQIVDYANDLWILPSLQN